jgi:hypothetical protein
MSLIGQSTQERVSGPGEIGGFLDLGSITLLKGFISKVNQISC